MKVSKLRDPKYGQKPHIYFNKFHNRWMRVHWLSLPRTNWSEKQATALSAKMFVNQLNGESNND